MKCEDAAEFVSALHDGERIPKEAAEHLGGCEECRKRLSAYSAVGTELRRMASLDEGAELRPGEWEKELRAAPKWWRKGKETMRIPRFAFALMLTAILLLSGGLVMTRARAGGAGPILKLAANLPTGDKPFVCYMATSGDTAGERCASFQRVAPNGMLSVGMRFIQRESERSQIGIKTRYDNPYPEWMQGRNSDERLTDVAEERIWVEPGKKQTVSLEGLGPIEVTGYYIDHTPPFPFSPDDTIDAKTKEFRLTSPVLLRGKEVVFNLAGVAGSFNDNPGSGDVIYFPGEGRFLFSLKPFKGAAEGKIFGSQVEFNLDGQDYVLVTGVPPTSAKHVWIKHEANYKPSEHDSHSRDDAFLLGEADPSDFPPE